MDNNNIIFKLEEVIKSVEILKKSKEKEKRNYYMLDYIVSKLKESLDAFKHLVKNNY